MADPQSNARLRADAGAPTSGVIHVRTRLTADFTVIANALAQRRGSAVTVGVAVYILSLPTGTPVTIAALCEHFTEGEILISRALRELEAAGYLERRRERLSTGQIRTRTYFYDIPGGDPDLNPDPDGLPEPPKPRRPRTQPAAATATPASVAASAAMEEPVAAPVHLEIRPVLEREAVLFCLDNQQLRSIEMVERLVARRDAIHRAVEKGGPVAYAVRHDRIEHTWP